MWTTTVVQIQVSTRPCPFYSSLCFFECPVPNRSFESANADAFLFFCLPFCSFLFAFLFASSSGSLIACHAKKNQYRTVAAFGLGNAPGAQSPPSARSFAPQPSA